METDPGQAQSLKNPHSVDLLPHSSFYFSSSSAAASSVASEEGWSHILALGVPTKRTKDQHAARDVFKARLASNQSRTEISNLKTLLLI